MNTQNAISDELNNCIINMISVVRKYIRLVDCLIAIIIKDENFNGIRNERNPIPDSMAQVLSMMLQALGSSSNTLSQLSEKPGLITRDCYSIVRSIVEIAVNVCFILSEGPRMAERAIRHARQKSIKDLERESEIGGEIINVAFSGKFDPTKIEDIEKDISEFTSRKGREKGWVDLSIDKRIEIAGKKFGSPVLTSLHFSRFMVYRHSSEILHGTFFSTLYFFGISTPTNSPRTLEQAAENIGQQHMMILLAAILALSAVIESFHKSFGFDWVYQESKKLKESLNRIPYLMDDE